ncbi:hypothetical protein FY136_20125 [Agrobacterium tumefaciens]|uniref:hypothetical protein n=1 Tax=Agrobacterium tumefaciens TaxID=358 RepID=UPI0021CE183D|nr:hypothetical protein [Agrobacterium tumefaciens]UXT51554.1 hypothetical protein FY136_20125 [Agrobacterium tumefaciens]
MVLLLMKGNFNIYRLFRKKVCILALHPLKNASGRSFREFAKTMLLRRSGVAAAASDLSLQAIHKLMVPVASDSLVRCHSEARNLILFKVLTTISLGRSIPLTCETGF